MDAAAVAALRTGSGADLLEQAMSAYASTAALTLGSQLWARGHPPDLVAAALTQAELRQRAVAKLGPEAVVEPGDLDLRPAPAPKLSGSP